MNECSSTSLKQKVAREAALLLYTSQEKEYKQAKLKAAETLGTRVLPSNADVARVLDNLAEEMEGSNRRQKLLQMRHEALRIMNALEGFHSRLVGSVWRGTARKDSDIDIVTFSSSPPKVLLRLRDSDFRVVKTDWQSAPKLNRGERFFHIYLALPSGDEAEVVVRGLERISQKEKCEVYGDIITGLSRHQLERVLAEDPYRRFVP